MRVVFDTNVLVSALLVEFSLPAQLMTHWRKGRFTLLTAAPQLEELTRVTRYPKIRARLKPALAGRLINDLRAVAVMVETLPWWMIGAGRASRADRHRPCRHRMQANAYRSHEDGCNPGRFATELMAPRCAGLRDEIVTSCSRNRPI